MSDVNVRIARAADVSRIVPLFDAYRAFYRQQSDPERARKFLSERAAAGDSILFIAEQQREAVGFAQVYPAFSSVRCARAWILNDLFVAPHARRHGVARALLRLVADQARAAEVAYVELSTETGNSRARALYESEGYAREAGFEHYALDLSKED